MEVIWEEMIKPSSPTPPHLRTHKLSLLDQAAAAPVCVPLILFYQAEISPKTDSNYTQKSEFLKQSLSKVLTLYYPLAGRLNGTYFVDCNDEGVDYVEARVHARLAQVIDEPCLEDLTKYLPKQNFKIPLAIQTNFFDCGGIAIGACISHKVADGLSFVTFLKAWAATCSRGDANQVVRPIFDSPSYFPPKQDLSAFSYIQNMEITTQKLITKRMVFNKQQLEALRHIAICDGGPQAKNRTRVEAVTAFILRLFSEVYITENKRPFIAASHAVNLRNRMNPPLPEQAFGNIWCYAIAVLEPGESREFHDLVAMLREAIMNIDSEFVETIQQGDEYITLMNESMGVLGNEDMQYCNFSSWCRFPIYEVDYGWGKPLWACTTAMPLQNLVILMSTKCGEGIEVFLKMAEEDVPLFQTNLEVHTQAKLNTLLL